MKKIIYILLLLAIASLAISCKKNTVASSNTSDNLFTETINNIQRNEPVLLSFTNNSTNAIDWQVTPKNDVVMSEAGNYATVKFATAGTYTAIAKVGSKQATYVVNVNDVVYNDVGNSFSVTASKVVGVNANEDVVFTVNNAGTGVIKWAPNGYLPFINVSADQKSAVISFKGGSSATVTVSQGNKTASRTIFINDSPSNAAIKAVPFIFGDKLNITPTLSNDKKTLKLTAISSYNYQCNSDKVLSVGEFINNNINISYGGVAMSSTLCSSIVPAVCSNSFSFNNSLGGAFPFTINYENKTFTGTVTVINNKYDFTFTNNSLINFTTKHVE